ncbi:MAG TPA: adenylate/guanylate cyclase domain-containing protein [Flavobacteriales bacterium]|nr:adenylate/guanylate cyclase domain-containing protein [Flavobacteriales bacterium]
MRGVVLPLLLTIALTSTGQADSLWRVWNDASAPDSARLSAMQTLAWKAVFEQPDSGMALALKQLDFARRVESQRGQYEASTTLAVGSSMKSDYSAALTHLHACLALAKAMKDPKREANTYSNLSNVYRSLGDLPMALTQLQKSLRIDSELGNKEGLAGTYNNMGTIQTELNNHRDALGHYERSAALAEELDSDRGRAQAALNLGSAYLNLGEPDTAAQLFTQGLLLYKRLGRKLEQGMAFNNLGRALGQLGRTPEAFASLDSAERIFTSLGSSRQLVRAHVNRGNLLIEQKRAKEAIAACSEGERIAEGANLLQQRVECLQCLHRAHELAGDFRSAYAAQSAYMSVNDSLLKLNNSKEVTRLEVTRAYQERMLADSLDNVRRMHEQELHAQERIASEKERRNLFLYAGLGVLALSAGLWNRLRYTRRSRAAIQFEKERSENLLLNILPAPVAEELKDKGAAEARSFDSVSVLFTDFKGFTAMSERVTAKQLVKDLHECFTAFDRICTKHGIEKIKTIGDAYMAAGGLPTPNSTHAMDAINAALEMRDFIAEGKVRKIEAGLPYFEIRIGIHTGPVVAGVVGEKKFAYDIWGDTVNTASRMESSGEVGQVNISEATYALVKDEPGLAFTSRGKVQAKGKGEMEMLFIDRHETLA